MISDCNVSAISPELKIEDTWSTRSYVTCSWDFVCDATKILFDPYWLFSVYFSFV